MNIAKLPELLQKLVQAAGSTSPSLDIVASSNSSAAWRNSQQFHYLRDLPRASFEYSPQLTQRSRYDPKRTSVMIDFVHSA